MFRLAHLGVRRGILVFQVDDHTCDTQIKRREQASASMMKPGPRDAAIEERI